MSSLTSLLLLAAFLILFLLYGFYLLLRRYRRDRQPDSRTKLRTYFGDKEHEKRRRQAQQMIDRIAEENLSAEQKEKLIEVLREVGDERKDIS